MTSMTSMVSRVDLVGPVSRVEPVGPTSKIGVTSETSDGCLCGCGKIVGGVITVPVVAPISLLIGVGMTAVACFQCRCTDKKFLDHRDNFCSFFGIGTGCLVGGTLIVMGVQDIRYSGNSGKEVVSEQTMKR